MAFFAASMAAAISLITTVCKPAYLKATVKLECGMILGVSTTVFTIIHVLISLSAGATSLRSLPEVTRVVCGPRK